MYFVFKKSGDNNLYWNVPLGEWVIRTLATVYTAKQVQEIENISGTIPGHWHDNGYWHKVVSEPVKLAEGVR
jgi:hypothetical protein